MGASGAGRGLPDYRNLTWHEGGVSRASRERLLSQRGAVIWLTGLSGSGKSTLAHGAELRLQDQGLLCYVLDGDNLRHGLNADLGFSPADRSENIRRVGEVAALVADAGLIVMAAFISPYREDRSKARLAVERLVGTNRFFEVFVDASIETCRARDPKGLYGKVAEGRITGFTGIDAPYEAPLEADLVIPADREAVDQSIAHLVEFVVRACRAAPASETTGEQS